MAKTNDSIYVVVAYRFGNRENHSYTIGAFNTKNKAIKCADSHWQYRGGKYSCSVEEVRLNNYDEDDLDYSKEVYTTPR